MNEKIKLCLNCGTLLDPSKRLPSQRYCPKISCQNARRRAWITDKLAHDPDYKEGKKISQEKWLSKHPKYWEKYKTNHNKHINDDIIVFQFNLSKNDINKLVKTNSKIVVDCKPNIFIGRKKFTEKNSL